MERHGKAETPDYYDREWKTDFRNRKTTSKLGWERREALAQEASKHVVGSVLDLGCGYGILARYVKGSYLGVDFSPFVIEKAKELNENRQAKFLVGDICHISGLDQFDTVVMLEVLEHLDDPAQAAESARRLARQRVVISVPRKLKPIHSHVWPTWSQEDVETLLGLGTVCRPFRRWWLAVWEKTEEI